MAESDFQRTFTYKFRIESDGKEVTTIKRSVKDIDKAMDQINKSVADNVKVTAERIATDKEAAAQVRRSLTETNKLSRGAERVTNYYKQLNAELSKTDPNLEVLNAQMRAGVSASSEQGKEIERLVTQYQQERDQIAAATQAKADKAKASDEAKKNLEREQKALDDYIQSLRHQASASSLSTSEQEVYNAQVRAGVDPLSEQGRVIAKLVRERQKNQAAIANEIRQERESNSEKERIEKQVGDVVNKYKQLNAELSKADPNLEVLNAQMRAGVSASSEQGREIERLVTQYQQLRSKGDAANGSMRNMRGIMQNVGWQMQDTVVQLQMGTDAFIVLSQQGSQIASAFGAGGAILGAFIALGGVVGGTLAKSLWDATDATEDLEEAQKVLNEVITTGSGTVDKFTQELIQLAKVDAGLARLKMTQGLIEADKALKATASKLTELIGVETKISGIGRTRAAGMMRQNKLYDELAEKLGITLPQVKNLVAAQREFSKSGNIEPLRNALVELNEIYGVTNEKLNENLGVLADSTIQANEYIAAKEKIANALKDINVVLDDNTEKQKEQKDVAADLIAEWANLNNTFGMTKQQLDQYNAVQTLTKSGQLDQLSTVEQLIDSYHGLAAARDAASGLREAQLEIMGTTGTEGVESAHIDRLNALEAAREADLISQKEYETMSKDSYYAYTQDLKAMDEARALANMQLWSTVLGQSANMMAQLSGLAEEGSAEAKALFFAAKALGIANTLVSAHVAATQAMADPMNPTMIGKVAAADAILALGYANAGIIAGTTIAGAFDKGGVIPQGQIGIVAEYGDELVDGMLVKGKAGGTRVTSRADTAKILDQAEGNGGGGMTIMQNITVSGNGDAALANAMKQAARQGAQEGYSMVARDFKTGRGIRGTLRKSIRV